jgi:hypothetical protein
MGEAKRRQDLGGQSFHMTKLEMFTFIQHTVRKASTSREERRKRRHMWRELGLLKEIEATVNPEPGKPGLQLADWRDNETPVGVSISGPTMDFMLQTLDGQQEGPTGEVLGELEERLLQLKDGRYELPDELRTEPAAPPPAESPVVPTSTPA